MKRKFLLASPNYLTMELKKVYSDNICLQHIYPRLVKYAFKSYSQDELENDIKVIIEELKQRGTISQSQEQQLMALKEKWALALCESEKIYALKPYWMEPDGKPKRSRLPIKTTPVNKLPEG